MSTTTELPPIQTWKRRADDKDEATEMTEMLERVAKRGSIRYRKRDSLLARVRRRMGWR